MNKPHNSVIIKLPFRKDIGLISLNRYRKIGFIFDNYVTHKVFIASGAKDAKEFGKWAKLDNGELRNFEFLYQAAERYCEVLRIKNNFTRVSLKRALKEAGKKEAKMLSECLLRSEMYGKDKKKAGTTKTPAKGA